jgi:hypothetical protein
MAVEKWRGRDRRRFQAADVNAIGPVERRPHGRVVGDREGRREVRVRGAEGFVFLAHPEEAAVMAVLAVTGRALALLDDGLDRLVGALEIGDDGKARQRGVAGADL